MAFSAVGDMVSFNKLSMQGLTFMLKSGSKSFIKCNDANVEANLGAIRVSTDPSI